MPSFSPDTDANGFLAVIIIHQAHFSFMHGDPGSPEPFDRVNGQILTSSICLPLGGGNAC